MNPETQEPEVVYEYIQEPDTEARVQHAIDALRSKECPCLQRRCVVRSDEVGENSNMPIPTACL